MGVKQSALSQRYFISAIAIIFAFLAITGLFGWQAYQAQQRTIKDQWQAQGEWVEHYLTDKLQHTALLMRYAAHEMVAKGHMDRLESVQAHLNALRTDTIAKDILFVSVFSWADATDHIRISNLGGELPAPLSIKDRDYLPKAKAEPWTIHISKTAEGRVTGKMMLPLAMGVADQEGNYLGTMTSGLLLSEVERALMTLPYGGEVPVKAIRIRHKADTAPIGQPGEGVEAVFRHSMQSLPLIVDITYEPDAVLGVALDGFMPTLLENALTCAVLMALLLFVYWRYVRPLAQLNAGAEQITHLMDNPESYTLPELKVKGPQEVQQLRTKLEELYLLIWELRRTKRSLSIKARELEYAREQAEEESAAKSDFLAHMSHELRTPLNAIIAMAEWQISEPFGPLGHDKYKEYLQDMHHSGRHLLNIISNLLDLSCIEQGMMQLQTGYTDSEELIYGSINLLDHAIRQKQLSVNVEIADKAHTLFADKTRMTQMLLNLLDNAVKHSPEQGEIRIAAYSSNTGDGAGEYKLVIADNGPGMSDEQVRQAFANWGHEQAHESFEGKGAGLGLPIARRLAELHGGSLEIDTSAEYGTRVIVTMPQQCDATEVLVDSASLRPSWVMASYLQTERKAAIM